MKRPRYGRPEDASAPTRTPGALPPQLAAAHDENSLQATDNGITGHPHALHPLCEAASPVETAAALIELALQESNGPVEQLGGALTRLARLAQAPAGAQHAEHAQLARDVAICIESLQFHDRLTQQLTQVRNILATLACGELPVDRSGRPLDGDSQSWQKLLEGLRSRFTSDSHRILFNLLLPGAGARSSVPALHASEGSVELF